jgi:hypothetical protein
MPDAEYGCALQRIGGKFECFRKYLLSREANELYGVCIYCFPISPAKSPLCANAVLHRTISSDNYHSLTSLIDYQTPAVSSERVWISHLSFRVKVTLSDFSATVLAEVEALDQNEANSVCPILRPPARLAKKAAPRKTHVTNYKDLHTQTVGSCTFRSASANAEHPDEFGGYFLEPPFVCSTNEKSRWIK